MSMEIKTEDIFDNGAAFIINAINNLAIREPLYWFNLDRDNEAKVFNVSIFAYPAILVDRNTAVRINHQFTIRYMSPTDLIEGNSDYGRLDIEKSYKYYVNEAIRAAELQLKRAIEIEVGKRQKDLFDLCRMPLAIPKEVTE